MADETEHIEAVDGQCGTCRWAKIDYGPGPSNIDEGVNCYSQARAVLYEFDAEQFKQMGWVNLFRLEFLAEKSFQCPHWKPRPGEVKDQWLPADDAEQVTKCPWCGNAYEIEGSYSDEHGYEDLPEPYAKHECGHYVCFRSHGDGIEESEEEYLQKVLASAGGAFWAQVAADYPWCKTGDFPPDAHIVFYKALEDAMRIWLNANW